jgi:hypothetical protein
MGKKWWRSTISINDLVWYGNDYGWMTCICSFTFLSFRQFRDRILWKNCNRFIPINIPFNPKQCRAWKKCGFFWNLINLFLFILFMFVGFFFCTKSSFFFVLSTCCCCYLNSVDHCIIILIYLWSYLYHLHSFIWFVIYPKEYKFSSVKKLILFIAINFRSH